MWILIWTLWQRDLRSITTASQEFTSEKACQNAGYTIQNQAKRVHDYYALATFDCVKK